MPVLHQPGAQVRTEEAGAAGNRIRFMTRRPAENRPNEIVSTMRVPSLYIPENGFGHVLGVRGAPRGDTPGSRAGINTKITRDHSVHGVSHYGDFARADHRWCRFYRIASCWRLRGAGGRHSEHVGNHGVLQRQ